MSTPMEEIGVSLDRATVDYPIYDSNAQVLQRRILSLATLGRLKPDLGDVRIVHALKNVTFDLVPGNAIGLIGRNGAGKSTLLKLMAGVLEPSSGTVTRRGSITSLLTIGSGMEAELDGYQNIRRVGLLRGLSAKGIAAVTEDIVEFAQLGDFISLPVRTYSAGMKMRLAFSIATVGTPDILLIDEVFGAGDSAFIQRAQDRVAQLLTRSKCVVFSSHAPSLLRRFCSSSIYLQHGEIRAHGDTEEIMSLYEQDVKHERDKNKTS